MFMFPIYTRLKSLYKIVQHINQGRNSFTQIVQFRVKTPRYRRLKCLYKIVHQGQNTHFNSRLQLLFKRYSRVKTLTTTQGRNTFTQTVQVKVEIPLQNRCINSGSRHPHQFKVKNPLQKQYIKLQFYISNQLHYSIPP